MDWKRIPPLNALRAFEATARHGNQSAAARELNVTHAAINQQIRKLEEHFGERLFDRDGRELKLTQSGAMLQQHVSAGFESIARGVQALNRPADDNFARITVTPAFYEYWLLPRISNFWEEYPDLRVEVKASQELVDLHAENYDLAVRYGEGEWPPYRAEYFLEKRASVFAAKSYLEKHPETRDNLAGAHWIRSQHWREFLSFHQSLNIDFNDPRHFDFEEIHEANAALLAGLGVLVQSSHFLQNELKFGLVEEVVPVELPRHFGYYIVHADENPNRAARAFADWLREQEANAPG